MTAISTLLSVIMLPFNLYVYTYLTYEKEITKDIEWRSLYASIFIVIFAIIAGFFASYHFDNHDFNKKANRLGNFAGVVLIIYALIISNSSTEYQLWDRDWKFYLGVAMPVS